jgi:aminopeptidase
MNPKNDLSKEDLIHLIRTVFSPKAEDRALAVLVDIPDSSKQDNTSWKNRRRMACNWIRQFGQAGVMLPLESCDLIFYPNIRSNNADLPPLGYTSQNFSESFYANHIQSNVEKSLLEQKLSTYQILLAPTEFSATAPLKLLAKKFGFRAATMPGFSEAMMPALKLDYQKIHKRVHSIKQLLDNAVEVDIQFSVNIKTYKIFIDLRNRTAHNSSGLLPDPGTAGNLPSGECYIVPNEGKNEENSQSQGILPVQFEDEVVLYRIENNRAVGILSEGQYSVKEKIKIGKEPAYGNIAEIGFGVLKDFGIRPSGELLLDEKLGLHIAFGRSDHFGGSVGPEDFSSPDQVVHIDRIYIPQIQNRIHVDHVSLKFEKVRPKPDPKLITD